MKRSKKYEKRFAEDTKMAMHKYGYQTELEIIEAILHEYSKEADPDQGYLAFLQEQYDKSKKKGQRS
ncbi:MAG: hypothetical protein RMJ53_00125 [Chitinophagales bacterium]|nr:hypothetical protein [Chitinophagales bacterium]MDW8272619.1 hypothetical protein [Chitinophagales bacterium]